ncbi:MAG: hypothetical protein H7A51_13510 [Akkermansiaceae bacterium]|nr:hypothetical protein [Akkermansiaceae bacterium]
MSDDKFHIPTSLLVDIEGETQLRYILLLDVSSTDATQAHIGSILEADIDKWVNTSFSGHVHFQCWNDQLEQESMNPVNDALAEIITAIQDMLDSNEADSAEGNRILLSYTLSKDEDISSEQPQGNENEFHMPSGLLMEIDGKSQLRYITYLEVSSPDLMQEHLATILDGHVENWTNTEFSGDVNFQCWNDALEPEHLEPIGDVLTQVFERIQSLIDTNGITSSDGNRVVLRYTLSKHSGDATEKP